MTDQPQPTLDRHCVIDVEGPTAESLVVEARRQGAIFLGEELSNLSAGYVVSPHVIRRSQYIRHLGELAVPLRWQATMKVWVDSGTGDQGSKKGRRGNVRLITQGAGPRR